MDDIKRLTFQYLPNSDDFWIVLFWGKVVLDFTGNYKIEVIFNQLSTPYDKNKANDFNLGFKQFVVEVNYAELRALSAGTVVYKGKIHAYIHNYRRHKKEIKLPKTQIKGSSQPAAVSFQFGRLGDFFTTLKEQEFEEEKKVKGYFNCSHLLKDIPVVTFKLYDVSYIVPCSTIADYYFFGKPKLIKYIFTGNIHRTNSKLNKVYSPKNNGSDLTTNLKRLAYIRLERDMFDVDAFKIARLANDEEFWNECIKISHNLIGKSPEESFIKCSFPFSGNSTLTVYGREINNIRRDGQYYLIHKIVKCSSPAPFDVLIVSRDNSGNKKGKGFTEEASSSNSEHVNGNNNKTKLLLLPKRKDDPIDKNKPPSDDSNKSVGQGKSLFGSVDEELKFENSEEKNFPDEMIINEEDLIDAKNGKPGTSQNINLFLKEIGDFEYTTEESKNGNKPIFRIRLNSSAPTKPIVPPTHCFEVIEKALLLIEAQFANTDAALGASIKIFCPLPYQGNPYSIFPIANFRGQDPELVKYRNFCFVQIKKNRHNIFRRILIYEIRANGFFFYVMDVQPKYKRTKELKSSPNEKVVGFNSSKAVIYFRTSELEKKDALKFLFFLVKQKGDWTKLINSSSFFRTFKHTNPKTMYKFMWEFIKLKLQIG